MATTTATKGNKNAAYDIITDKIVDMLKGGEIPWNRPWQKVQPMGIGGHKYRGINFFLMNWIASLYTDPRYMTFNQAKKLGGTVKKGEHGWPVILWNWFDKINEENGTVKSVPFCKVFTVFNVDQTEGCKIPELKINKLDFVPSEKAEEIISAWGNKPIMREGGERAYYSVTLDTVTMPMKERFNSNDEYYGTLFHELGHSTGHVSRLDRFTNKEFDSSRENYSIEELTAEMTSAFIMAECDMDSTKIIENSAAYIQSWIKALKDDPKMLVQAAAKAQKAADLILGKQNTVEETE